VRLALSLAFAAVVNLVLFLAMVRMVDARFAGWEDVATGLSLAVVALEQAPPPPDAAPEEPAEPALRSEPRLAAPQLSFEPMRHSVLPSAARLEMPQAKFALHGRPFLGNLPVPPKASASPLAPRVRVEPQYPRRALSRRIEGYVVVGFTIEPDGTTSGVEVLESEPPRVFDRSATKAVERWRFEPRDEPRRDNTRFEFELSQ